MRIPNTRLSGVRLPFRRRWLVLAAVLLAGIGVLAWTLRPAPEHPRARPYLAWTACLLTDDQGLVGGPASHAWAGMQDASLATHAKVQYLPVIGPQTLAAAQPYLASLIQRQCAAVVAAGDAPNQAIAAEAAGHPGVLFVGVGARPGTPHVTAVATTDADQIRHDVAALITDAVHRAGPA